MEGSIDSHRTSNLITYAILGLTISIHTSSVIDTLFAITTATFARNITMWISLVIAHQRALDTTLRRATPRLFTRLSVRHLCPAVCTAHRYLIKSEPQLSQVHVHRRFDTLNKHRRFDTLGINQSRCTRLDFPSQLEIPLPLLRILSWFDPQRRHLAPSHILNSDQQSHSESHIRSTVALDQ